MNYDKILGCLLGGAVGDAMGAATEIRSFDQIQDFFGGYVREFHLPPNDTFAHGCKKGQITDDFSIAYMNCKEIAENDGLVSEEIAKAALVKWYEIPEFSRFAGPTTKASVMELLGQKMPSIEGVEQFKPAVDSSKGSNGGAMKAAPLALFSNGNVDKAIEDTVIMCKITHNNNVALSGACAVSSAAAEALNGNTNLQKIFEAGIYGAEQGDLIGRKIGNTICGPSVTKRIRKAIEIGSMSDNMETALKNIMDYIGCGLMAAEAVPAAFGIIAAANGNVLEGIYGGVNIGDDTDTVATMIGGILGAWHGAAAFPKEYLSIIKENNDIDIEKLAKSIFEIVGR